MDRAMQKALAGRAVGEIEEQTAHAKGIEHAHDVVPVPPAEGKR
jgi:hypothetical protein